MLFSQGVSDYGSFGLDDLSQPYPEIGLTEGMGIDEYEKFPAVNAILNRFYLLRDSLVVCNFCLAKINIMVDGLNALTGFDMSVEEVLGVGERVKNLLRAYNTLSGATANDDYISPRLQEAPTGGPRAGKPFDLATFNRMKREYYKASGWDEETSKPLPETLKKSGLEFLIPALWCDR
jgi:aldehyde:ferredoxin oxidoreductase